MSLRLTLIGHPVNHSLSPPMHRAAFLSLGCAGNYDLTDVEVERFSTDIHALVARGVSGWNVTVPHKERMYDFLVALGNATLTPEARLVGAVNTVRIDSQSRMHGHNTDMPGFRICVEKNAGTGLRPETAVVLGAGGAARACVAALCDFGYKRICVLARKADKAVILSKEMEQHFTEWAGGNSPEIRAIELRQQNIADIGKLQLLVNCTPVGLTDSEPPVGFESLLDKIDHDNGFFIDTVYRRDQATTLLCGLADAAAVSNCDGRSMLVEQAVLAFEFWTGRRPDASLFDEALRHSPRL